MSTSKRSVARAAKEDAEALMVRNFTHTHTYTHTHSFPTHDHTHLSTLLHRHLPTFLPTVSVESGARGVVDVESLFHLSLTESGKKGEGEGAGEGEGDGSEPKHDLRHILENMEVFVVDADGKVVGGKRGEWFGIGLADELLTFVFLKIFFFVLLTTFRF